MSKRSTTIFIALLLSLSSIAQIVKVGGVIRDENGEAVELATVRIEGTAIGTVSDLKGRYSLKFNSRDSVTLVYSMIGHYTRKRTLISPKGNISMNITLPTAGYELGEVTVSEKRRQTGTMQNLDTKSSRLMPDASGGSIEAMLTSQAGVSSNNELSTQYNVRGGSYDENMVYVNGVEVYRPLLISSGQQEGLSFVNPDMTANVGFSTGGFNAEYGDKMSSVLDITYRKPEHLEGKASVSLLGASAYVGSGSKRWSWINGLRYKSNRYLLGTLDTKGEYNPRFIDYQTCFNLKLSDKWLLEVMGNISENKYSFTPEDRTTKYGTLASVKEFKVYFDGTERDLFRTLFGSGSLTYAINKDNKLTLRVSTFKTKERETYDIAGEYWLSELDDSSTDDESTIGVGSYMEHARNYLSATVGCYSISGVHTIERQIIKWGAELKSESITGRMREWELRDSAGYVLPRQDESPSAIYMLTSDDHINSTRISAYAQDCYKFISKTGLLTLTAGIRGSYWSFNKEFIFSPRASLSLIPSFDDNFTFRVATGVYYQAPFYKEMRNTAIADGNTYVELNRNIKSQRSIHAVIGGDYNFKVAGRPMKFTAEAYYKALSDLVPYNVDNLRVNYYGENVSKGYATGLDMKLFGEFVPGTDSWLTLSLMKTEEKIDGKWIARPTDQRYNLSLYFTDYFPGSRKWTLNLHGTLAGGLPFGAPHMSRANATFRTPPYKRIDIGMSRVIIDNTEKREAGGGGYIKSMWIGVDVFNLLNISNVNSYYWVTDVYGGQYAVPNYLTARRINVRLTVDF
jgi:hypothetical protein